eukprot:9013897-Prorocentrum_lima.AAC.1
MGGGQRGLDLHDFLHAFFAEGEYEIHIQLPREVQALVDIVACSQGGNGAAAQLHPPCQIHAAQPPGSHPE